MNSGRVSGIAVRTEKLGPMKEIGEARVEVGGGIDGDVPARVKRGVTLISKEQWQQTMNELNAELPWHTRRANVLVEGVTLSECVGRVLRIGNVEILIHGETEPCGLMDTLHQGLQKALEPEMRAGVHGEVVQAGTFRVGDTVTAVE